MRYAIVYLLPPALVQLLRTNYLKLSGQPLTLDHLHLTLIPSFFLNPGTSLTSFITSHTQVCDRTVVCALGTPKFFNTHNRYILYLPVLNPEPLITLHDYLVNRLSDYLNFDLSVYDQPILPPYLPHVTIDYHFTGDQTPALSWQLLPPQTTLTLSRLVILGETKPNVWTLIPNN